MRSHEHEARERLRELLALGSGSPSTRAKAQTMIGALSIVLGDLETAQRRSKKAFACTAWKGDDRMVAFTVGLLGTVALIAGDTDTALALSREAHEVARRAAHPYVESAALWQVGACLAVRGELDGAERTLEEAIRLERKLGNARSLGIWLKTLAGVAIMRGDQAQARPPLRREPGHPSKPGRRMGRIALSVQPRLSGARRRRRGDGARAPLRGPRDRG